MKVDYIRQKQEVISGHKEIIGFGNDEFSLIEIERERANKTIVENHYSKKYFGLSYIHLGVFINKKFLGVLQLGYAMNPASAKNVVKGTQNDEYLELNRMWLDDEAGKNSESMAISYAIKYIRGKYKKVKWIQSFADERCGLYGLVYQASNFKYFGEHESSFWELDNEVYHNILMTRVNDLSKTEKYLQENKHRAIQYELRQFRYIFFMNKYAIKDCMLKEYPYPKHYSLNQEKTKTKFMTEEDKKREEGFLIIRKEFPCKECVDGNELEKLEDKEGVGYKDSMFCNQCFEVCNYRTRNIENLEKANKELNEKPKKEIKEKKKTVKKQYVQQSLF